MTIVSVHDDYYKENSLVLPYKNKDIEKIKSLKTVTEAQSNCCDLWCRVYLFLCPHIHQIMQSHQPGGKPRFLPPVGFLQIIFKRQP